MNHSLVLTDKPPGEGASASRPSGASAGGGEAADDTLESDRPVDQIPDMFGREVDPAAASARRSARRGADSRADRRPPEQDLSDLQPAGCVLKKYVPENGSAYWFGKLPEGRTDNHGRVSRRLTWGCFTQRSETETVDLIQHWLNDWAQ